MGADSDAYNSASGLYTGLIAALLALPLGMKSRGSDVHSTSNFELSVAAKHRLIIAISPDIPGGENKPVCHVLSQEITNRASCLDIHRQAMVYKRKIVGSKPQEQSVSKSCGFPESSPAVGDRSCFVGLCVPYAAKTGGYSESLLKSLVVRDRADIGGANNLKK